MAELDILYSQRSLTKQINQIKSVEPFALKNIFKNVERHASETIDIEIISGYSDVAQFSGYNENEPHQISKNVKAVKQVTIPRTFEAKVFSVQELRDLNEIGKIYDMTADEKRAVVAEKLNMELAHLKDRALRLREKMAIEALSTGKITVSQSNVKFTLDFGYVTNKQKETLTGDDTWDTGVTVNIPGQIHSWRKKVPGANVLILDPTAAGYFMTNTKVTGELDNNNLKVGALDYTQTWNDAVVPLGKFRGLDVYEYIQQYDNGGSDTNIMGSNKAVLVNTNKRFTMHFAPVFRIESNALKTHMTEFFVKPFTNPNGTVLEWQVEQKSLPAIFDLDAVYSVTVA